MGSWDLGMGNATSIWYANLWGSWGMLAWGMQSARIMPTFQTMQTFPIVGMGNAGSNSYAKTSSGLGSLPILAWVLLQEGSPYWHGVCYQQLPCQKKSSIRVHFVLDISTKIWYNSRLDFWKWGACAENSFPKFQIKWAIAIFGLFQIILHIHSEVQFHKISIL